MTAATLTRKPLKKTTGGTITNPTASSSQLLPQTNRLPSTKHRSSVAHILPTNHSSLDIQGQAVGGTTLDSSHGLCANQHAFAAVTILAGDQSPVDDHSRTVPGDTTSTNQDSLDTQCRSVGGQPLEQTKKESTPSRGSFAPYLYDPAMGMLAQQLNDLEGLRKAQANRILILIRKEPDKDGELRGFALPEDNPAVRTMSALFDGTAALEHETVLALQKTMRQHPLGAWQRSQKGVGEKTLARLLAVIGDPYIRLDTREPRTVSQLWAYCGLHTLPSSHSVLGDQRSHAAGALTFENSHGCHDAQTDSAVLGSFVAAKRRKGVKCNWSTEAKTRAYLISEALVKAGVRKDDDGARYALTEYGQLYIDRRNHTAATHPEWTPAHSQNDAMRILSKRLLRNLWRAARDIHNKDQEVAA